ncbi:hypothetical protein ElyMa_001435500 [Elysia marginata]|uniref:Uncharacterized protein n=1 Tax=Elysia marginata TaxID=1093978 RepID=A0AAV4IXL1_9GAST|nr:hypothetical protein ElyMa_001435500 [Elysia marginata]
MANATPAVLKDLKAKCVILHAKSAGLERIAHKHAASIVVGKTKIATQSMANAPMVVFVDLKETCVKRHAPTILGV